MTVEEMRARKRALGYSNKRLAEVSGVPLGTLQKILSGVTVSPRFDTIQALERALLPVSKDQTQAWKRPEGRGVSSSALREASVQYGSSVRRDKARGEYTLEDYYALPDERRVELIDGVIYEMASPSTIHQALSNDIAMQLNDFIRTSRGSCRVFQAPLDVQLDRDDRTMVQPDIVVICKREQLRRFGCFGPPDLVMEILSPSTARKDLLIKLQKYMAAGVREYWVVNPVEKQVVVYGNQEGGMTLRSYSFTETVPVGIWENRCEVDFRRIYEDLAFLYELEE